MQLCRSSLPGKVSSYDSFQFALNTLSVFNTLARVKIERQKLHVKSPEEIS